MRCAFPRAAILEMRLRGRRSPRHRFRKRLVCGSRISENRAEISNDVLLQRAGEIWRICDDVSHIGDSMASGRYVTIFAPPPGGFMYAIDGRVDGPMTLEAAWSEISAELVILFYAKEHAAH